MNIEPALRTELYAALDQLKAALETAELWEAERPPSRRLESQAPFCYDTLAIHQWLQWRFIPRLRAILDHNGELPETCAIYPYAELCFVEDGTDRDDLLRAIRRLDDLITTSQ